METVYHLEYDGLHEGRDCHLKERTPQIPVTTNFMKEYDGLDYHKMQQPLDVVSWDSYPRFHNDEESFSDTMTEMRLIMP